MTKKFISGTLLAGFLALTLVSSAVAQTTTSTMPKAPKTVDLLCVQTAVAKREAAIGSAVDAYYAAVKAALSTRASALNTAWGMTVKKDRNAAIMAAWNAYKTTFKKASQDARTAKKAAWSQFGTDAKTCRADNLESAGQAHDLAN
jgi:hypothetical protein